MGTLYMPKKKLKINETALSVIVLLVVAVPSFSVYNNKKITEETLQKQQADELIRKTENDAFIAKYDQQKEEENILNTYAQEYELFPYKRDTVHRYVRQLLVLGKNEQAYNVINKYFRETPKDSYWDDIDLWIESAVAAIKTKRCLESITEAWHITNISLTDSMEREFAEAVVYQALNETKCIE